MSGSSKSRRSKRSRYRCCCVIALRSGRPQVPQAHRPDPALPRRARRRSCRAVRQPARHTHRNEKPGGDAYRHQDQRSHCYGNADAHADQDCHQYADPDGDAHPYAAVRAGLADGSCWSDRARASSLAHGSALRQPRSGDAPPAARSRARIASGAARRWYRLCPALRNNYPNNLNAWLISGPFDLSDATAADVSFMVWQRTQTDQTGSAGWRRAMAATFMGGATAGASDDWEWITFDLSDVPTLGNLLGQPQVWIAFLLQTDGAGTDQGVFVDAVLMQKWVDGEEGWPAWRCNPAGGTAV